MMTCRLIVCEGRRARGGAGSPRVKNWSIFSRASFPCFMLPLSVLSLSARLLDEPPSVAAHPCAIANGYPLLFCSALSYSYTSVAVKRPPPALSGLWRIRLPSLSIMPQDPVWSSGPAPAAEQRVSVMRLPMLYPTSHRGAHAPRGQERAGSCRPWRYLLTASTGGVCEAPTVRGRGRGDRRRSQ